VVRTHQRPRRYRGFLTIPSVRGAKWPSKQRVEGSNPSSDTIHARGPAETSEARSSYTRAVPRSFSSRFAEIGELDSFREAVPARARSSVMSEF